ncbi:glycosyl hydrolase family 18 protein [Faecalimonas sp.]
MNERDRREQARRRSQLRKRRQRSLILKCSIVIGVVLVVLCGTILWKKYGPSDQKANRKEYYGITNEEQLAVIVNNEVLEPKGRVFDGKVYLEYSAVRDYVNGRFYWDSNENLLLYTLPNDIVSVSVGSSEYAVSKDKKSEKYVILKTEGNTAYIALDFVKKYTDIEYKTFKSPKRVVIQNDWSDAKVSTTKSDSEIRMRAGVKSPILTETKSNDVVRIIETEGKWKKVRTQDGFIGYVKNSDLKDEETKTYKRDFKEQNFTNIKKDYTINLAWHQVSSRIANKQVLEMIANTKGLTTLAPTWFSVKDLKGNITSIASAEYVNYAHQSNIEVWGLVRNFDPLNNIGIKTAEETHELLSRTTSRENLENQLISAALQVGLDGINVDFETIAEKTGEHYIQFIRELSVKCRKNGIILSVDNYVPKGYNKHYHRKEQGIVADYVVIMGYDEHFSGSYESGSVASIGYVKDGIKETLKEVPANKVINAMPLYTRLWSEVPKTEAELSAQAGTEAGKYSTKVTSETVSMKRTSAVLAQYGVQAKWDGKTGQNYAQWEKDGVTYKIWIEDAKSIEEKLKAMKANKLAGTAVWKLGFEAPGLWDLILKYVN